MAGITAIHGVDDTLKQLARNAVKGLATVPDVTVGPLAGPSDALRVNWFLYRIEPHAAFRNMEHPRTGWQTSRGRPPLALRLHYLLTAFPGATAVDGDREQFSHAAIAAVIQTLDANPVIGNGDTALSAQAKPLTEPLRIAMEPLDLDALSKLWMGAGEHMRLSVGYEVTLIAIDPQGRHVAGPPVKTRRVPVVPSVGPRLGVAVPARVSDGDEIVVEVTGVAGDVAFTLAREAADPAGPDDWPMTVVHPPAAGHVTLALPGPDLAPGLRRLDVRATADGLPAGGDALGLTIVPAVSGPAGPIARNTAVDLGTAHAAPDVEVFVDGAQLPASAVVYQSPTKVTVTLPPATPVGAAELMLRAGKVAGPAFATEVAP
jgi:hypothetical protein